MDTAHKPLVCMELTAAEMFSYVPTNCLGKWHLGWDKEEFGDQRHGPLGHGFDHFYGLPFTLVDGFEKSYPFFTYSKFTTVRDGLSVCV